MERSPSQHQEVTAIDFGGWRPLLLADVAASVVLRDASRTKLMEQRHSRCLALQELLASHGVDIPLVADQLNASNLGAWLLPRLPRSMPVNDPRGHGLCTDVSLWLGQGLVATASTLRWQLLTSHKKSTGYHRAVLSGFTKVDDPHYYVDIAHFVAAWFDYALRQRAAKADFLATIFATTLADA
jgi:hypothetical protein